MNKSEDKILSSLASDIINRNLFRVEISEEPFKEEYIEELKDKLSRIFDINKEDVHHFISISSIQKDMYDYNDERISILYKDGTIRDISEA